MSGTPKLKEVEQILLRDVEETRRHFRLDSSTRDEYARVLERFNRFILYHEIPHDLLHIVSDSPFADNTVAELLRTAAA